MGAELAERILPVGVETELVESLPYRDGSSPDFLPGMLIVIRKPEKAVVVLKRLAKSRRRRGEGPLEVVTEVSQLRHSLCFKYACVID